MTNEATQAPEPAQDSSIEETPNPSEPSEEVKEDDVENTEAGEADKVREAMQKRIDKTTYNWRETQRQLDEVKAELSRYKPKLQEPIKPKESDFDSIRDYEEALDKYADEKAEYKASLKEQEVKDRKFKEEQESREREKLEQFSNRQNKFKSTVTDFDEVADRALTLFETSGSPASSVVTAAIMEMESGPRILYELGNDPVKADHILSKPPIQAITELVRMEMSYSQAPQTTKPVDTVNRVKAHGKGEKPLRDRSPEELVAWLKS